MEKCDQTDPERDQQAPPYGDAPGAARNKQCRDRCGSGHHHSHVAEMDDSRPWNHENGIPSVDPNAAVSIGDGHAAGSERPAVLPPALESISIEINPATETSL
ncbi:hypothetical protein ACFS07_02230 [Undibacterium arcticum]